MKKKMLALLLITIMLLALVPQTALAASHTVSDGQTLNLTSGELTQTSDGTLEATYFINAGDTISVAAGATATITGSKNVQISCGAGVTLTLDSVTSDVSETNNACALGFTGSGNTLILEEESALSSGQKKAGVLVQGSTQLTIEGTGMLEARGGTESAGIGAGTGDCGTLLIRGSVTINARGGTSYGAGIGGAGDYSGGGSGGNITIESGTVTAIGDGNNGSAGIGGGSAQDGYGGNGGNITIKGGTVKAVAGYYGAGIGGGGKSKSPNADGSGRGGVINISGGTVIAVGGKNNISGGGIGCGGVLYPNPDDPYTELNITGGNVFVAAAGGPYDFSVRDNNAEFNISNDAAVFLRNDNYASSAANITSHTRYLSRAADEDGYLFGIELPGWPSAEAAFIVPKTVSYDLNGVDGTPISDAIIHSTGVVKIPTQDMTGYNDQELVNWNTQADGLGVGYTPGMFTEVEDDITLYAIWGAHVVSGVTLARDSLILSPGAAAALEANVTPSSVANASLSWTSSNESVATVDSRGVVTAVGTGSTLITVESENGLFDTCQVAVSSVLLNYTISTGSTMEMQAAVSPTGNTATWTSDDETVATVDADGTVTAKAPGIAMITVTAGGVSQTCGVAVYHQNVTSVKLSRASADLTVNDSLGLTAYVDPDDAVNRDVVWTSSDEDVVTVNGSGTVTAMGSGSATITAQSGGHSASCSVTVTQPVTSVSIGSSAKTLSLNETASLSATVSPSDATDANVTWTSSDTDIATVDANGKVTAVADGAVTIIVDADGAYAVCTILVSSEQGTDDGNDNGDNDDGDNDNGDNDDGDNDNSDNDDGDNDNGDNDNGDNDNGDNDDNDNAQATPTPTSSAKPSGENGGNGEPSETNEPTPTPTPKTVIITIVVADLPEGTTSVKLPDGSVVELDGGDTLEVEVGSEYLNDDGSVELIALDNEDTPLGIYDADNIATPDTGSTGGGVWSVLMWVLIGIVGLGVIGGAAYLILRKRQGV